MGLQGHSRLFQWISGVLHGSLKSFRVIPGILIILWAFHGAAGGFRGVPGTFQFNSGAFHGAPERFICIPGD